MPDDIYKKVEEFFSVFRVQKFSKGHILILNGDTTSSIFYLLNGKVKEYDVTERGDEVILNVFKPKSFFPMSLALNPAPCRYIFEAETDIEVRVAPSAEVVRFIQAEPDVMLDLLKRVYAGMDGVLGRMTRLMSGSARSRLAYELVLEAERFSKEEQDGSCTLSINEKDLGARAALSRETVSREIRKFKVEKLLTVDGKGIIINDIQAFRKILAQAD